MSSPRFAAPLTFTILTLCCLLGACSKQDTPPTAAGPAAALPNPQDPQSVQQAQQVAHAAALPQPDAAVPLDQYVTIKSGEALMYLFYGISKMPPDMNAVAEQISADYRMTSDQFKRQDMLKVLTPRIQASIAEQGQHRYVIWEVEGDVLEHYDFNAKRFPIKPVYWNGNSRFYWNDLSQYQISFTAPDALHDLQVADEALARDVEGMLSKYQPMRMKLYAFVQDTDLNSKTLKAVITHVELLDRNGRLLIKQ